MDLTGAGASELARELLKRFGADYRAAAGVVLLVTEHPELGVGFAAQIVAQEFMGDREAYGDALRGWIGSGLAGKLADEL